jgi:mRNA interferase YafQ
MRTIKRTSQFKRDYKRERSGKHGKNLDEALRKLLSLLMLDEPLDARYKDHQLKGEWSDFRDCHLKPDPVLIYRKPDGQTLELIRLGSHSELGW